MTSRAKRRVEIRVCSTYAPFLGAIFEGGVLAPPSFAVGGEERGEILLPILLTLSDGAKEWPHVGMVSLYWIGPYPHVPHIMFQILIDSVSSSLN